MVGNSAIANATAQPAAVPGHASSPVKPAMMQKESPAPDVMTALAPAAGTELITLSPTRM